MNLNIPHIEQFSFWVGFAFASLLWFLLRISRSTFNLLLQRINESKKEKYNNAVNIFEENYRNNLYQRVQGLHLAASLFSLDEVLIEPRLLSPPPRISPDEPEVSEDFVSGLVPYLPEWPEISAAFNAPTLSIANAISGNSDIVLIGQPGAGKSVALAYVASLLSQQSPEVGLKINTIPFLVDLADINFSERKSKDGLALITECILGYYPNENLNRFTEFIKKTFVDGNALLLLDGTDELTSKTLIHAIEIIKSIKQTFPLSKIITTGTPEILNGLVTLNFIPFTLACWGPSNQKKFLAKWGNLWSHQVANDSRENSQNKSLDNLILNNWIFSLSPNFSPLEFTLFTWGCYAGDVKSGKILDSISSHIQRLKHKDSPNKAIELLALQMLYSSKPCFDLAEAKSWIKEFIPDEIFPETIPLDLKDFQEKKSDNPKKEIKSNSQTPPKNLIHKLIESGLIIAHINNKLSFSHQVYGGYLAGIAMNNADIDKVFELPDWSGKYLAMGYYATFHDGTLFANKLINSSKLPLHRNIFIVSRWLRGASMDSPWRIHLMEKLVEIYKIPGQPLGLRGQALAALVRINDDGIRILLRQLLDSEDPDLLQLCILGVAILKDIKSIEKISGLLVHKSPNVVRAACLGLVTIGTQAALDQVANLLLHAEKEFRKIAAEALANDPYEGHSMLREGASLDDFLVRWAVVYGLGRISNSWAIDLISKLRLEDDQWIVRNAANEVMERKLHPIQPIPKRLPPPSECPWLIAFAAQKGLGISPTSPATEILLLALTEGTELEKLASLDYLRISSSPKIFPIFYRFLQSNDLIMREAIFRTLWEMAARGVIIPEPNIFSAS